MEDKKFSRRRSRINSIQILFAAEYNPEISPEELLQNLKFVINDLEKNNDEFALTLFQTYNKYKSLIDTLIITQMDAKWSYGYMPDISKAILKTATAELLLPKSNAAIIINEFVEISKVYGAIEDFKYIHAILGSIINVLKKETSHFDS